MNNYDDEATQYQNPDNEATRFEDTTSKQTNDETTAPLNNDEVEVKAAKGSTWKRAAVGAGSGLFVGGVATVLMSMKKPDGPDNDSGKKDDSNHKDELSNPEWVDDEIAVATSVNDDETNTNIGGMKIDGQDVILVDIDNDLAFDYMAADANNNNQIDRNELVDIQDQNLTVNDLGGFSNPAGDLYANDEGPDYSNDGVYES